MSTPAHAEAADDERVAVRRSTDRPVPRWTRGAYLAIVCVQVATVLAGFWPRYFGPLLAGGVEHFWFVHVHAGVFAGWMALLLVQSVLVVRGAIGRHRLLGRFGAVYGLLVLGVGIFVSVAAPVARVHAGQLAPDAGELVVLYNLTDMLVFGAFFMLALRFRARPALHRRLILCATVALTGAAVGRVLPGGSASYAAVWLAPIVLGVAVDIAASRRLHPVFVAGSAAFAFMFFKVGLMSGSPMWRVVGHAIMQPFV